MNFFYRHLLTSFSLYILSLPFIYLLDLPYVNTKIQAPELIFVLSGIYYGFYIKKIKPTFIQLTALDKAILLYVVAFFLSCLMVQKISVWLEWGVLLYLFGVYMWGKVALNQIAKKQNIVIYLINILTLAGVVASLSGILGYGLSFMNIENPLAWNTKSYYPYLGYVYRAKGWMITANMLASFLTMVLLLKIAHLLANQQWSLKNNFILSLLFVGLILTFSRLIIVFFIGVLVLMYFHPKHLSFRQKITLRVSILGLFVLFNFGTHFLILNKNTTKWQQLTRNYATEKQAISLDKNYLLAPTPYWILKGTSIEIGKRHLPFGIGSGQSNTYLSVLKKEGYYPASFSFFDPHSTYFGAFAEVGILGLLSLLILFFIVGKTLKQLLTHTKTQHKALLHGLTACFVVISIEAISCDLMNFRHYWVLLAVLGFLNEKRDS